MLVRLLQVVVSVVEGEKMQDDVALSLDGTEGFRGQAAWGQAPYMRRPQSQTQPQGPMSTNHGSGPGLPFMTFDLASGSGLNEQLSYGGGYGASGGDYASFEDEPPLLEGMCACNTHSPGFKVSGPKTDTLPPHALT